MEADIRDVLLWYDTKHAYEAKGFCGESHAAGFDQAATIILNAFKEGRLVRLIEDLRKVVAEEALRRHRDQAARR